MRTLLNIYPHNIAPDTPPQTGALRNRLLTAAALAAAVSVGARTTEAQQPKAGSSSEASAQKRLLDQARYWSGQGRLDLAKEALSRLLAAEPDNIDGIYEMARVELADGDAAGAQTYARRLGAITGNGELSQRLQREMDIASIDQRAITQARERVKKGEFRTAIQLYDRALGGRQLEGELAVEYFETMAGIEDRWEEAQRGLQKLLARSPGDIALQLALARIATYRTETRREGLGKLLELADNESVRDKALNAARSALQWLDVTPEDQALFESYAAYRPEDKETLEALNKLAEPDEEELQKAAHRRGFASIEANDLDAAIDEFGELVRQDRNDVEALAGLGIAYARKGEYASALDSLRRAVRLDPDKREDIRRALEAAEFGSALKAVRSGIDAGDYEFASALLAKIKPSAASQKAQIASVEAEIAAARGDLVLAERGYRQALDANPQDEYAFAGLLDTLLRAKASDRLEKALATYARAPETTAAKVSLAKARGWLATRRGDVPVAIEQYRQAVALAPEDAWLRLDAARALKTGARLKDAEGMFDGVDRSRDPAFANAAALFAFEGRDWARVGMLLGLIADEAWTPDMHRLANHARLQIGVDQSLLVASAGDATEARRRLLSLYTPGATPLDDSVLLASALLEIGDNATAASLVRQAVQGRRDIEVGQVVDAARILAGAMDYDGAEGLLRTLEPKVWKLSEQDRIALADTHDDILIGRARDAVEAGDLALALNYVAPVYDANPVHGGALRTLGEINVRSGRKSSGLKYYLSALDIDPKDQDALKGAVGVLLSQRDFKEALSLLDSSLVAGVEADSVHRMRSEVYRASGDLRRAMEALEEAQMARAIGKTGASQLSAYENPFRIGPDRLSAQREAAKAPRRVIVPQPQELSSEPGETSEPATPSIQSEASVDWRDAAQNPNPALVSIVDRGDSYSVWPPAPAYAFRKPRLQPAAEVIEADAATIEAPPAKFAATAVIAANDLSRLIASQTNTATVIPAFVRDSQDEEARAIQAIADVPALFSLEESEEPVAADKGDMSEERPRLLAQYAPHAPQTVRERLAALEAPGVGRSTTLAEPPKQDQGPDLSWEIAELRDQVGQTVSQDTGFRWREGEAGLGRLLEFELPAAFATSLGAGRLTVTARPVFLTADSLGDDPIKLRLVGAFASVEPELRTVLPDDSAGGVGFALAYDVKGLHFDIGSTPLGFDSPIIVGGVSYSTRFDNGLGLEGSLARRPVTDSLLSYSGLTDTITGEKWGAVTDTRLRVGASIAVGDANFYAVGAGSNREGQNVESNLGYQLDTGMLLNFGPSLSSGLNVTYFGFEQNQRYFTFGHGGYFSPQNFVAATIPLNYEYESERMKVSFRNALGVQYYDEDGAALYPGFPSLQARAATVAVAEAADLPGQTELPLGYEANSKTSITARSAVEMDYRILSNMSLNTRFSVDRSGDWTEVVGLVGIRYRFGVR